MLQGTIDPIWKQSLVQIINFREGANDSAFAKLWSNLFFLIQTYNFFTAFFFLSIVGQPTGVWYLLEVICEILMIFDFAARWLIRVYFNEAWQQMFLLHDRGGVKSFHFYIRLIASIPYQIIISIAVSGNPSVRDSIWIASLRLLKLLKFSQVVEYFNAIEFQKRQMNNYSLNQTLFVLYYLFCFLHVWACIICLTGRIDPESTPENGLGWINQIGLSKFQHTIYDMYRESLFNTLSTMVGASAGLVMATTNLENFVFAVWFISGTSVLMGYFSWLVTEWTLRNIQNYDNSYRYELAKQFCTSRNLPQDIRLKIRYYYQNMRVSYEEYNERMEILQGLPERMKTQISPLFNSELLKNIKFLQMAKPEFVAKIACKLHPEVSLNGDLIVKYNEIADKMYFVQEGNLEVLATDHFTTIAFLGSGAYFGEIGVLITGKRSLSVKALSNILCYTVNNHDFLAILEEFPEQTQFLRAVGYQRLQTTRAEDIITHRTSGEASVRINTEDVGQVNDLKSARSYNKDISFLRLASMPDSKRLQNDKIKTKPWLTKQFNNLDYFIVMPFSLIFYVWNAIMLLSFTYVLFIVPYGIGFNQDFGFNPTLIICQIVFAVDIPIRMRTGITEPKHITTDLKQIFKYYIDSLLFYDMLASIPIEYVLQIYYPELSRWIMLLKFFKVFRLIESLQTYLQNTNLGNYFCMFALYSYLLAALCHLTTCCMCYLCEKNPTGSSRFDGKSLITFYKAQYHSEGDPMMYSDLQKYNFYLYYGTACCCNQLYADVNPMADSEEYASMIAIFFGRVIMAFAYSETANYLSELYRNQSRRLMSTSYLNQWMKKIKLPQLLINRIKVFNEMQIQNKHQAEENQILEELPPTLQNSIKSVLFAPLIRTWEAISKENIGEVMSIVNELDLIVFPENEFIVKIGEVGEDMYFIVDGLCQVLSADNTQIAVLKQGQNFGEMALMDSDLPLRIASVKTLTNVQLAILTKAKFIRIQEQYPQFKENIQKMVKTRIRNFINSTTASQSNMRDQMLKRLQASSETLSNQTSRISESLTDSDFDEEVAKLEGSNIQIEDQYERDLSIKNDEGLNGDLSPENGRRQQFLKDNKKRDQLEAYQSDNGEVLATTQKFVQKASSPGRQQKNRPKIEKSGNKIVPLPSGIQTNRQSKQQLSDGVSSNRSKFTTKTNQQDKRNRKTLVRSTTERLTANLTEMSQNQDNGTQKSFAQSCMRVFSLQNLLKVLVQLVVHYNIWFIPIHTAYKFKIAGVWLILEGITISTYAVELIHRFFKHRNLKRILYLDESQLQIKDRKLKQDYDKLQNKISLQITEFFLTLVAIMPINLIFDRYGWYRHNVWLDVLVMSLRLVKIRPLFVIFEKLAPINLPLVRVLETIYYNYVICSFYSVILIDMSIWDLDARTTWIRRLPVSPSQWGKLRESPNPWTDITPLQMYLYAQYYLQSTLSHVAIGDITMTNSGEWFFNALMMWSSTFIYIYLFSNIASIVSNLTSETHISFLKKRNNIVQKIKSSHPPKYILSEVNLFFDYQFEKFNGLTEKEMTEKLPERIQLDIKLVQYQSVIQQSTLFRKSNGDFDLTLANTFLRTLKTKIYLSENFITQIGQTLTDSFIVLEGWINVCSHNGDNLGVLGPGDFFGTDLSDQTNFEINKNFFQYTQGESQPQVKLQPKDNFENIAMVNLVSKSFLVIGVIKRTEAQILYKAFPGLKKVFRHCNRYLFEVGRKQIEKIIQETTHKRPTREDCLEYVREQIAFVSVDSYDEIMRKQRVVKFSEHKNLSYILKNYYIIYQPKIHQKKLYQSIFGKSKHDYNVEAKHQGSSCCCEDVFIEEHGKLKRIIRYIHFFNMIYTSLALPFLIAHNIRIRGAVLCFEVLSSCISLMVFLSNFRTPHVENGEKSLNLMKIAKEYLKNGMIVDFFGMLPFNIIFDFLFNLIQKDIAIYTCCLVAFLRCTRIFSIVQVIGIFESIKIDFKKNKFAIQSVGNIFFCFLVGHWIVCIWTFLILVLEKNDGNNWWYYTKLDQVPIWSVYLRNWYIVMNTTTGVGCGDAYAVTDVERVFYCIMMNIGDVVFALVFGLINNIVLNSRVDDETGNYINSMVKIERTLAKFEITATWKDRIEQFYTFKYKIERSSVDLCSEELEKYLPQSLVRKVLYHQFADLVRPFCRDFGSENLIKDICYYLKSRIYMPDDYIMTIGEIGTHMYFVFEGTVQYYGADDKHVIEELGSGSYIGEKATMLGMPRNVSVRAKTFVLVKEISREEIQSILITYPEIHKLLKERAAHEYKQQGNQVSAHQNFANLLNQDVQILLGASQASESDAESSKYSDLTQSQNALNRKKDTGNLAKNNKSQSTYKTEDAMKYINDQIQNIELTQKKTQALRLDQRQSTIVGGRGVDFLIDRKLSLKGEQPQQQTERMTKRVGIHNQNGQQNSDDSLKTESEPKTKNSKVTVSRRLSGVNFGQDLSIQQDQDSSQVNLKL